MKRIIALILAMLCLTALLTGCDEEDTNYKKQIAENEANAASITSQYGVPDINRSLDYENVKRRLEYLNQGNNIGYLYLLSDMGVVLEEVLVLGKVTSLNTYITPMQESQLVKHTGTGGTYREIIVIDAADVDGTYGENVQGIFWFTPDGVYGEWDGRYRFSSERLTFQTEPILIMEGK